MGPSDLPLRQSSGNSFVPITYLSCLEGDWKAGREYSGLGLDLSLLNPHLLLLRILLEHETGESAQGEIYLERLLDTIRRAGPERFLTSVFASMAIASIARITGLSGRLETAEAAAKTVLSEQSVAPVSVMQAKASLALLAAHDGNQSDAEENYANLLGQRGTMIYTVTSVDRLLGLLSQTMGELDQAMAHFEEALAFCRKAGYRPELAWSCCDYAELLLQRASADQGRGGSPRRVGAPTDHDRANPMSLLEESLAIASELGMPPLMARVVALMDRVEAGPVTSPIYPDGLTQREVEVLRLIAGGKTNLEIAEELVIAEGTARRHVANIYEKIGAANRADAARYAIQKELMGAEC
jgi:ATP/maltotriose-dependent transcriptional regulator MalT